MDIKIEITRKKIKNIILKVTSDGRVLISAPTRVPQSYLKEFIDVYKRQLFLFILSLYSTFSLL